MLLAYALTLLLQAPYYGNGVAPGQSTSQRPAPNYNGPGDTAPAPATPGARPGPGPGAGAPSTGRPTGSGGQPGPATSAPSPAAPRTATLAMTSDDGWWLWWEYNKTEFLKPKRRPLSDLVLSLEGDEALRQRLERARLMLTGLGETASRDDSAVVRAAAVISLGRVGQEAAMDELTKALQDPHQDVRHATILALGANGGEAAQAVLVTLARTGMYGEKGERVSPYARPLALVALGLGRRAGFGEEATDVALEVCKKRDGADRDHLASALFLHHALAPDARIQTLALAVAKDEREAPAVRCRAIEALRASDEPLIIEALEKLSGEGRLDVRRSAAMALATCEGIKAFSALNRALEAEKEPLTRGLILASMARRSEPGVSQLLSEYLAATQTNQRAWAALALGIHARSHEVDPEQGERVRAALRALRATEKDDYTLAALDLAAGLVRDDAQRAAVMEAAAKGQSPQRRAYAMTALSLYGDAQALDRLAERISVELDPLACVIGATGLAVHGRPGDAQTLASMLARTGASEVQAQAAAALGLHGTTVSLDALLAASLDTKGDRSVRAAALQGLGFLLTRPSALAFTDVSRQANYTVMPEWVAPLFASTL